MVEAALLTPYRIKPPQPKSLQHIAEVVPEYVDRSVGDVMCVRYDGHSKFAAASYSSGALRVLNSVTGKVV